MARVKRALLSCHDKAGLDAFAKALATLGVELVASGGTAEFLRRHGLQVTSVEDFAGSTEQLDGRVKTLHPKIHAGILALRDQPSHMASVGSNGLIDLVVVNLYPFEQTIRRPGVGINEALEQIDIGGVALLRAGAKNFASVAVVCDPQQYARVADALQRAKGELPAELARQLACAAFELTSRYDRWIAEYLGSSAGSPGQLSLSARQQQVLRYGENPHQQAAWCVPSAGNAWGLATLRQLQGKELSYNNLLDLDAAVRCLLDFHEPACVIVKHAAPCGIASDGSIATAYERALACDPESAFGGIVAFNRPLEEAAARALTETFLEVIAAPEVDPRAASVLSAKPKLRLLTLAWPSSWPQAREWRQLLGGWLVQDPDAAVLDPAALRAVTKRAPTGQERDELLFAWKAAKHAKSNGIVIARDRATCGIGQGQPSRVGSVRLAIEKAGPNARGAVAASDGFFPFPDGVELLAKAGVRAVIQPGGSLRDRDVIDAADRADLAMLFTGIRHFRH